MTDYASLHWQELKKRVEAAGFPWINKADAAEKLAALDEKLPAAEPVAEPAADPVVEPEIVVAPAKKSGPCLDRSKPYGQIGGELENYPGACYEQGGVFFNSAGNLVEKV